MKIKPAIKKQKYVNKYISLSTEIKAHIFLTGCSNYDFNEYFYSDTDGILGLNYNNSFVNLLYQKKVLQKNLFSICLNSNQGGYLSFGQINENSNEAPKTKYHIKNTMIAIDRITGIK